MFTMIFIILTLTSNVLSEEVPKEAYIAANKRLERWIKSKQKAEAHHKRIIREMRIDNIKDLLKASIGEPYKVYEINYKDLKYLAMNGNSITNNKKFIYYNFPIMIDDYPRGMISIQKEKDIWVDVGLGGLEPIYEQVFNLRNEMSDKCVFSFLFIGRKRFAMAEMIENNDVYLIPANEPAAWLIGVKKQDDNTYPMVKYEESFSSLIIYRLEMEGY